MNSPLCYLIAYHYYNRALICSTRERVASKLSKLLHYLHLFQPCPHDLTQPCIRLLHSYGCQRNGLGTAAAALRFTFQRHERRLKSQDGPAVFLITCKSRLPNVIPSGRRTGFVTACLRCTTADRLQHKGLELPKFGRSG